MRIKGPIGSKWKSRTYGHVWQITGDNEITLVYAGRTHWVVGEIAKMDYQFTEKNFKRIDFNLYYQTWKQN